MKTLRIAVFVLLCAVGLFAQVAPSTIPTGSSTQGYGPWAYRDAPNADILYKMLCFENGPMTGPDTCLFRDAPGHLAIFNGAGTTQTGALVNAAGTFQTVTPTAITTGNFTTIVPAASDILIPAGSLGKAGKLVRIHADGIYTTAAASVLNVQAVLCTVSGCGSGTVFAPAGCVIVTTNQANVLANGQWKLDCTLTSTSTVGAAGTFMAKGVGCANLGASAAVLLSCFADTATAVSAAADETVNEFVSLQFKFTTANAGNTATAQSYVVEVLN